MNLKQLQREVLSWENYDFPDRPSYWPLLGAVEELGELAHAHLKEEQGIRRHIDHEAEAKDAVADCIIFLANYCNARGWNLQQIIENTWQQVKKRDWQNEPDHATKSNRNG